MMDKVLVVDDDLVVQKVIAEIVENNDIAADRASSGEEALEKIRVTPYSAVLLDINMTGIDGFEVIRVLRAENNQVPVMVVTARDADRDTLHGLEIGADEYVTKPFNPVTLGAKLKALIRRSRANARGSEQLITAGPFTYDTSTLRLFKNGAEIVLTGKENALMKLFVDNVGHIFSRDVLYEMVWGNGLVDNNAVMVYINRLRTKIEDDPYNPVFIQNVRGIGYRFVVGQ